MRAFKLPKLFWKSPPEFQCGVKTQVISECENQAKFDTFSLER